MPVLVGAGALTAVTTRLRRAGRLPTPVRMPAVLVHDPLSAVPSRSDTDKAVAEALTRLAGDGGNGSGETGRAPAVSSPRRTPATAVPRRAAEGRADAASERIDRGVPDRPAHPFGRAGIGPLIPTAGPRDPATDSGPAGSPAWRPPGSRLPAAAVRLAGEPGPAATARAAPAPSATAAVAAATPPAPAAAAPRPSFPPLPGGRTAEPVRIRRDATLAELLVDLADPDARSAPGSSTVTHHDPHHSMPPRVGAQADGSTSRRPPTPRTHATDVAARFDGPGSPRQTPLSPRRDPDLRRDPGFVEPPVGLAGLVGWWQTQTVDDPAPTDQSSWSPVARPSDSSPPGYGPDETNASWSAAVDTPTVGTDQLRDALERLLLDEALADGLEVGDGSA
ncbi:MAG TPA: hypothetical protein VIT41_19050 [Microlunatus sp.]